MSDVVREFRQTHNLGAAANSSVVRDVVLAAVTFIATFAFFSLVVTQLFFTDPSAQSAADRDGQRERLQVPLAVAQDLGTPGVERANHTVERQHRGTQVIVRLLDAVAQAFGVAGLKGSIDRLACLKWTTKVGEQPTAGRRRRRCERRMLVRQHRWQPRSRARGRAR